MSEYLYVPSYVTRDVLKHGVRKIEVRAIIPKHEGVAPYFRGRVDDRYKASEVHATLRQAAEHAEKQRLERIAELTKEIDKLRFEQRRLSAMCFLNLEAAE